MLDISLVKKPRKRAIRPYLTVLLLIAFLFFFFFFLISPVLGYVEFFSEDFETYNLGDLGGQQGWVGVCSQVGNVAGSYPVMSGEKSVWGCGGTTYKNFDINSDGILSIWVWLAADTSVPYFRLEGSGLKEAVRIDFRGVISQSVGCSESACGVWSGIWDSEIKYGEFDKLKWNSLQVRWNNEKYQLNLNFGGWSEEINFNDADADYASRFELNGNFYIDKIGGELSDVPQIIGTSPVSGSTVATEDTNFYFEYQNLDWDTYDGFIVNFKNSQGVIGTSQLYEKADLGSSGWGSEMVSLDEFGIDRNGNWYLTGLAFGSYLDIEGGMFLTTRGYIDFWSNELVIEEYYLDIDIEGLAEIYPIEDFDTWYSENVEEFATPTAMAMSITGFMTPIFQTVGEFNDRAQEMFDTSEAYDRGFALGEIFPLMSGYVNSIGVFFGGFPILSFFRYVIILMFGIFLIKAILKFIPFFGK